MQISDKLRKFTKSYEGLRLKAYQDVTGHWTIGYGHTSTAKKGMEITKKEANELFEKDMQYCEDYVNEKVTYNLKQHQFDALCDHVFNVGSIYSGLAQAVANANHDRIAYKLTQYQYSKGKYIKGLAKRSKNRALMYQKGEYINNA